MDKKIYSRQSYNKVLSDSKKSDGNQSKSASRNDKRRESPNNIFKNDQRTKHNNKCNKIRTNCDKRSKARISSNNGTEIPSNALAESISSPRLIEISEKVVANDVDYDNYKLLHLQNVKEINSIYSSANKKQNLNHLLNFQYPAFERVNNGIGLNVGKYCSNKAYIKRQKYNKEQYLQANFQFIVKNSAESCINISNPDVLIDWNLIEQVNIQTTEECQCPICLYPPIAAKLTRCGHVYCWPCILHYLALSDKNWRKCPICYEAIHIKDLKSTSIIKQKSFKPNDLITFQLMRRKKGSIFAEKYFLNNDFTFIDKIPSLTSITNNFFPKFLLAGLTEIVLILVREYRELQNENDIDCPDAVFVQQALDLLQERKRLIAEEQGIDMIQLDKIIRTRTDLKPKQSEDGIDSILQSNLEKLELEENVAKYCSKELKSKESNNESGAIKKEKFYYFYQSIDGQNIFLHPLNVKMLQSMYGTLCKSPNIITSKILQKEFYSMDEDLRKKFTCLGHLPLTCQFEIVEVSFKPPLVTDSILKIFKDDITSRQITRNRRDRQEKKREKLINEFNDRQMGKLIAKSAKINIESVHQFPTCGFEDISSPNLIEESVEVRQASSDRFSLKPITSFATILSSPKKEIWPTLANTAEKSEPVRNKTTINQNSNILHEVIHNFETFDESRIPRKNVGNILTQSSETKKQNATSTSVKKGKKSKKTLLFSTAMNFSGN